MTSSYQKNFPRQDSSSGKYRALFLDRDGVINIDRGYVHHANNFEFIDGIFEISRKAHAADYKIIVITNQSGIARGYYSVQQFQQLTSWMCNQFLNEGVPIEKVYFSPFHPTAGIGVYKKDDASRKPRPGMIYQAQKEINLNLENSILIGDKASDIQAGVAAGVGLNILFKQKQTSKFKNLPCQVISSLHEAIFYINGSSKSII